MSTSRTREKADGELFKSTGIDDNATSTKVTVSNTGVEVTGDITLTSAGSIKTQGTDMLLGTADTGIRFYDQTSSIYPVNVASSSDRDNAVDLGHPSVRFKDAYLSGGVYLGGTGAANKLDDYETGTFTASIRDAPSGGNAQSIGTQYYTKIGNQVTVWLARDNITISGLTANNTFFITGLPFTSASTIVNVGSIWWQHINTGNTHVVAPRISVNVSYIRFDELRDSNNDTGVQVSQLNNNISDIVVTMTYQAA